MEIVNESVRCRVSMNVSSIFGGLSSLLGTASSSGGDRGGGVSSGDGGGGIIWLSGSNGWYWSCMGTYGCSG